MIVPHLMEKDGETQVFRGALYGPLFDGIKGISRVDSNATPPRGSFLLKTIYYFIYKESVV